MSSIVNKVKEAIHGDKPSQPEGTHGHHNTRVANAADPRIDSDRDHRAAHNVHGTGENLPGSGNYTTGSGAYAAESRPIGTDGPATRTDGPHKSNMANKADPRVDSDRDRSRNMGMNPEGTSGTGAYNVNETTRTGGLGGNVGAHENLSTTRGSGAPEGTFGPHGSRVANAADPRIDSDLDGSRNMGARSGAGGIGNTTTTHGTHNTATHGLGTTHGTTTHGTHNTATHGLGTTHGTATHGSHGLGGHSGTTTHTGQGYASGPAPNTAGPHKSDMMNKADPRVDSDLDGSKTMGGDKTFSRSNENTFATHKDPTDAAQVPPSVLQKHVGAPVIAHDDHEHDRTRRHSVSHQEQHRGL